MYNNKYISAVIPAAGIGKRMQTVYGDTRKQFIKIHGKPVLFYTLLPFQRSSLIDEIILVCEKEWRGYIESEIVSAFELSKVKQIVIGGEQRQDSVLNGFRTVTGHGIVVIHDAARPMVTGDMIQRSVEACDQYGAAIVAVSVKDTIKTSDEKQCVGLTVDRSKLWQVQTPQCFEHSLLVNAFRKAYDDRFYGTDESSLVERTGHKVKIVEGDYRNIKITTPEDVTLAECYLKKIG